MSTQPLPVDDCQSLVTGLAQAGRHAQRTLARMSDGEKAAALLSAAAVLRRNAPAILADNARDLAVGEARGLSKAMLDRLMLDDTRLDRYRNSADRVGLYDRCRYRALADL